MNQTIRKMQLAITSLSTLKNDPIECFSTVSTLLMQLFEEELQLKAVERIAKLTYENHFNQMRVVCASKESPLKEEGIKTTNDNIEAYISTNETTLKLKEELDNCHQQLALIKTVREYLMETLNFVKYYMVRIELLNDKDHILLTDLKLIASQIREELT